MGLAKSSSNLLLKRRAEAEKQAAVLPVDITGTRQGLKPSAARWMAPIGDETGSLIDIGPMVYPESETVGDVPALTLPPLSEGYAQVEGLAEFSSARAAIPAVHAGV